jgi:glycosyltransferase involved in cell wall biosynthesis
MRILILSDDFPPHAQGGAGIIAHGDALVLRTLGHEVVVVTSVQKKEEVGTFEENGIIIHRIYSNYPRRVRAYKSLNNKPLIKELRKIVRDLHPDVVHAHNIHEHISYYALKLAKESGARVFLTAHDAMTLAYGKISEEDRPHSAWKDFMEYRTSYNPFRNIVIKRYLKNVYRVFAVSDALSTALQRNGIENVVTMHNGIAPITESAYTATSVSDHFVLFGGRLSGAKGAFVALAAMKEILKDVPDTTLLIAGKADTDIAKKIHDRARELDIEKSIKFLGWLSHEDMERAILSVRLVTVLSLYLDPFPTINLEAMAAGKPVVGTKYGGTKEVVAHGETGYVVDPNNTSEVAGRMVEFLKDEAKAVAFGAAGRERVQKYFSLDERIKYLLKWYNGHER